MGKLHWGSLAIGFVLAWLVMTMLAKRKATA